MEDKLHPLTELMLARMKSHPEEFEDGILTYGARWDRAMHEIEKYGSDADKQAMHEGLRPIRLGEAHTWAMDELLNGEERRRKQREEEEDYMARMTAGRQQSYSSTLATAISVNQPTSSRLIKRIKP